MWEDNYASKCHLGNIGPNIFQARESSARAVLVLHSFRTLNTFFYAFSISGFAIERYYLVCKATADTFVNRARSKSVFYVVMTVGPFLFWVPFVGVLFWDKVSLFMGPQLTFYVGNSFLKLIYIKFLDHFRLCPQYVMHPPPQPNPPPPVTEHVSLHRISLCTRVDQTYQP